MAASNRFALLGDEEDEDPSTKYTAPAAVTAAAKDSPKKAKEIHHAKLPSKPLPPAEAVRTEKDVQGGRGRGRTGRGGRGRESFHGSGGDSHGSEQHYDREPSSFGGRGGGRGGRGGRTGSYNQSFASDGERASDGGWRGGRDRQGRGGGGGGGGRGFYASDEKQTGTGAAREAAVEEATATPEASQEVDKNTEKKEEAPEDKEMTLDEYEKIVKERRKSIGGQQKVEERKVEADSELKAMQVVDRKSDDDVFIKLGSDKDKLKKKDSFEKDEKSKKVININEFLRPSEGSPRGRGRGGRGGGGRGNGFQSPSGGGAARYSSSVGDALSPSINSPQDFPQLGKNHT